VASFWNGIARNCRGNRLALVASAVARLRGLVAFWVKAFLQPTIDLTLRTHPGLVTRIVERPGLALPQAELDALMTQLRIVAGKTLPAGSLAYGIFSGERDPLARAIVTLVSDEANGQPIAFNALSLMEVELDGEPVEVTHLGLVMVDPDVQGRGLSWVLYGLTTLVLFARDGLRQKWISNVTQVPAVAGMVSDTFSDVFPSPNPSARRSFAHLQLARVIMRGHRAVFGVGQEAGFDDARFVITNAYTGGSDALKKSYDEASKHRDERYTPSAPASLTTPEATTSCRSAGSIWPARGNICSARCRRVRCRRCLRRRPC
jgi:GNAT superfamily N-acetyltransferase